jgi:hypothetical protein
VADPRLKNINKVVQDVVGDIPLQYNSIADAERFAAEISANPFVDKVIITLVRETHVSIFRKGTKS